MEARRHGGTSLHPCRETTPSPRGFRSTATPLPLTSAHLELERPHFSSCRWDCELCLPSCYLCHPARGQPDCKSPARTNPAYPSCTSPLGGCHTVLLGAGLGVLGWAGSPPQQGLANRPPFFSAISLAEFHPSLLLPLHLTPASPTPPSATLHPPQPVTAHPASRQDHSSAPPEPIWPLQPSYPQHHLVYSMTCTSTPMNCIAPHSQVDTL